MRSAANPVAPRAFSAPRLVPLPLERSENTGEALQAENKALRAVIQALRVDNEALHELESKNTALQAENETLTALKSTTTTEIEIISKNVAELVKLGFPSGDGLTLEPSTDFSKWKKVIWDFRNPSKKIKEALEDKALQAKDKSLQALQAQNEALLTKLQLNKEEVIKKFGVIAEKTAEISELVADFRPIVGSTYPPLLEIELRLQSIRDTQVNYKDYKDP